MLAKLNVVEVHMREITRTSRFYFPPKQSKRLENTTKLVEKYNRRLRITLWSLFCGYFGGRILDVYINWDTQDMLYMIKYLPVPCEFY